MTEIPEEIIIRSISKTATAEELMFLKQWLEEDEENISLYFQLEEIWSFGKSTSEEIIKDGWEMLEKQIMSEPLNQYSQNKTSKSKNVIPIWLLSVAAMLIGAFITSVVWIVLSGSSNNAETQSLIHNVVYNNNGVHALILPDGSKVWLNENSSLMYPNNFIDEDREVVLTGSAYFDIDKDAEKTFVVKSGDIDIEVTGTEFFVEMLSEYESTVTLISGMVNVNCNRKSGGPLSIPLEPGHQVSLCGTNGDLIVKTVNTDYYRHWKDGTYRFEDETLEKIISIIEERYGLGIHISSEIKEMRFTGRVTSEDSIDDVLKSIQSSIHVNYYISGNNIYITK